MRARLGGERPPSELEQAIDLNRTQTEAAARSYIASLEASIYIHDMYCHASCILEENAVLARDLHMTRDRVQLLEHIHSEAAEVAASSRHPCWRRAFPLPETANRTNGRHRAVSAA